LNLRPPGYAFKELRLSARRHRRDRGRGLLGGDSLVGLHPGTAEAVAGVLVFLVVGMSTAYTPVLLAQFLPDR
jgi:hypothetical protein